MLKNDSCKYDFVVKGAYGTGNFGDDALFEVIYSQLPKGSRVAIIARNSGYLNKNYPLVDVFHPNDVIDIECDYYIYGGGTQFYLFPSSNSLLFKIKYHFINPTYLINKLLNRGLRINYTKKIGIGLGLGPFYTENTPKFVRIIRELKAFESLSVRDQKSFDFCLKHQINGVQLNTDLCFIKKLPIIERGEKSAVILRDWIHDDIGRKHFPAIKEYLIQNKDVTDLVLFAHDKEWIDFALEHDIELLKWEPKTDSSNQFIEKISKYKFFISSRFHGVVYGTLLGIPAIAIEIEPKLRIGASLNTGLIWQGSFELSDLYTKVEHLNKHYSEYLSQLNTIRDKKYTEVSELFNTFLRSNSKS
ncbi:polysaccharide pyruvyl transferase family protein [Pseudoalteromonas sp. BZP1]|uniref:polysaccharide pyruvyl transferase family protein n=1 Tax=unclassified Pseudoalteromonas TaxID=194690 RepID=UPI0032C46F28